MSREPLPDKCGGERNLPAEATCGSPRSPTFPQLNIRRGTCGEPSRIHAHPDRAQRRGTSLQLLFPLDKFILVCYHAFKTWVSLAPILLPPGPAHPLFENLELNTFSIRMLQIPYLNPFGSCPCAHFHFPYTTLFPPSSFLSISSTLFAKNTGGEYQLFPKWNSGTLFHESRITSHESRITPLEAHSYKLPRCQFLCHQSLTKPNRNDMSTNHL